MLPFFADCAPLIAKIEDKTFRYAFEVVDFYNTHCGMDAP